MAAALLLAQPAWAQQLELQIGEGRVTLRATNVPVRQILAEWARLGGTRIVNVERVTGGPVTLTLVDVPESQALDIVLRSVAGYLAAPRVDLAAGASRFDRVVILATSTAPPVAPAATAAPGPRPVFAPGNPALAGTQRRVIVGAPAQAPDPDAVEDPDDGQVEIPEGSNIFVPGAPSPVPFGQPGQVFRFPGSNSPIVTLPVEDPPEVGAGQVPPQTPGPVPAGTPGVVGSPVPGVVSPAPTPQRPRPPGQR